MASSAPLCQARAVDGPHIPPAMFREVERICLGLPETTLRSDHWAHAFEIRRKVFAFLLSPENPEGDAVPILVVRADPLEREALVAIGHPYFGTRSGPDRIGVVLSEPTDWEEITELVTESYRILAPKKLVKLLDG